MSERKCALESKTYQALKEYYVDRDKAVKDWKMSGKKVVLTLGCDVPDEVIIAAGMLPVKVYGEFSNGQPEADKYLERSFGPVWRAMWEQIVNCKKSYLYDYIAISRSSDMLVRMYYYLRELKRFEPERPIPTIKFIDYEMITRSALAQQGNNKSTQNFISTVEGWIGRKITEAQLQEAIRICNENRDALAQFSALRYGADSRITGTEALTVIGASLFMEKQKSTELIKKLTEEAKNWPKVDAVRVFFTGSVQENLEVYELIEELGGNVVSEDSDWGDRHFNGKVDPNLEAFKGITARYMYRMPSSERGFVADRCEAIVDCVKNTGAQAVLVYMNFNDESYLLDYPSQKVELDKLGIPSTDVTLQRVPIVNKEKLVEKIEALIKKAKA